MGQKATFDPVTKIIQITAAPVNGVVSVDVKVDLYSDMKEDWKDDPELIKYRIPIRAVGGDPLPGSKALGSTFFLDSNWSIRPYNTDHRFIVNGNLYREDGTSPFINTVDVHNVLIESTVSNLVDSTVQQLQEIERSTYQDAAWVDVTSIHSGTSYPNGNVEYPVNNLEDAIAICHERGFLVIQVIGNLSTNSVNHDISSLHLKGVSHVNSELYVGPDTICNKTSFSHFEVDGTLDGDSEINDCIVHNIDYFNGHIHNSALKGYINLHGGKAANIVNCVSADILDTPTINTGGSGQNLMMPNFSGRVIIQDLTGDSQLGIGLDAGDVILEDTCTSGVIAISGNGRVTDNSGVNCYVVDNTTDGTDIRNIKHLIENLRPHHTGTGNVIYWSPNNGNDSYDGAHKQRAFKTWAAVDAALIDNNHDIVVIVPDATTGNTVINEKVTITKNYVFLRGPGRDVLFDTETVDEAFLITGNGVELSGFRIHNALGNAVRCTGSFLLLDSIWMEDCLRGLHCTNSALIVQQTKITHATEYAILLDGMFAQAEIRNTKIGLAGTSGVIIDSANPMAGGAHIVSSVIFSSGEYGVDISATSSKVIIDSDCVIESSGLANVNDNGIGTIDRSAVLNNPVDLDAISQAVWDHT